MVFLCLSEIVEHDHFRRNAETVEHPLYGCRH